MSFSYEHDMKLALGLLGSLYVTLSVHVFTLSVCLPINTQSGQNRPDNFGNILLKKAFPGKHF